jgi:hypothetical protein
MSKNHLSLKRLRGTTKPGKGRCLPLPPTRQKTQKENPRRILERGALERERVRATSSPYFLFYYF